MTCFGGSDEQLYLLELSIDKLKLPPEKFKDIACIDGADCPIVVKIKFLNYTTLEISRHDFYFTKPAPRDAEGCLEFSAGRALLFVKQPRDLVREMQGQPLKIGIFCAGDTYPIAETEVQLSGCLCDQISMSSNDQDHMPPSYTLKGGYNLIDPGENPSGMINLELKLSCIGKSVTTHYQLNKKSLYFKNDRDETKYYVKRVLPLAFCSDEPGKDTMKCGDSMLPVMQMDDELDQDPKQLEVKVVKGKEKKKKGGKKEKKKSKKKK